MAEPNKIQPPAPVAKQEARKQTWNVLVRHSPFLLKQADVEAESVDEAKKLFIELNGTRAKDKAAKQKGAERDKDKERVHKAYQDACQRQHEFSWTIRPASEVLAQREAMKNERAYAARRLDLLSGALAPAANLT